MIEDMSGMMSGLMLVLIILLYVHFSSVLMTAANKLKATPAWTAWIPPVNLYLMPKMAKAHWLTILPALIPYVNITVLAYWFWKNPEHRKKPTGLAF